MATSNAVIGIDLGTTSSRVAVLKNGQIKIISNSEGYKKTPCEVAFKNSTRLVGDAAKKQAALNPKNTIFNIKRLIGRRLDDIELHEEIINFPYEVLTENLHPVVMVDFKNTRRCFTPEELSAMVIRKMKDSAEKYLGNEVKAVVVTVPAYFNYEQRRATKYAARIAGFDKIRLINEPTAAAIAFGFDNHITESKTILFFDLGGGTYDVSIIEVSPGHRFEVKSTSGDTSFGGSDFDQRLLKHFAEEFHKKHDIDITRIPRAMRRLLTACAITKEHLSTTIEATIEVDSLHDGIDFFSTISRDEFEKICEDLFQKVLDPVRKALDDANMDKSKIDEIVPVGGCTRIPKVQQIIQQFFDGKGFNNSINPDEAVVCGAAALAASLAEESTNADRKIVLQDVTPHSISLKLDVKNNQVIFWNIVPRNTTIPSEITKTFHAISFYPNGFKFKIYEKKRTSTEKKHKIVEIMVERCTESLKKRRKVEVTSNIDIDGIITVTAVDLSLEKSCRVEIGKRLHLNDTEIERMIADAESYRNEEKLHYERIKAREKLEEYSYKIRDLIDENVEEISEKDYEKLRYTCENEINWLENNKDAAKEVFESRKEEFESICGPIFANMRVERKNEEDRNGRDLDEAKNSFNEYLNKVEDVRLKNQDDLSKRQYEILFSAWESGMGWYNKSENATKEMFDSKREELHTSCRSIIANIEAKNELEEYLKKIGIIVKKEALLLSKKDRETMQNEYDSFECWFKFNGDVKTEVLLLKYDEMKKACGPIIEKLEALNGKHGEDEIFRIKKSRYMMKEYLRKVTAFFNEVHEIISEDDEEVVIKNLKDGYAWLEDNIDADEKSHDARYKELENSFEPIISKVNRLMEESVEKERIEARDRLRNVLNEISDGLEKGREDVKVMREECRNYYRWLKQNQEAGKDDYNAKYKSFMRFQKLFFNDDNSVQQQGRGDGFFSRIIRSVKTRFFGRERYLK